MILGIPRVIAASEQGKLVLYRWPFSSTVSVKLWSSKSAYKRRYRPRILKVTQVVWDQRQNGHRYRGKWWVLTGKVNGEWRAAKKALREVMAD